MDGLFGLNFWRISLQGQDLTVDKIIAKVNTEVLLKSELEEQFLGAQRGQQGLSQCEILQNLVHNKVLLAQTAIDSIVIADAQIDAALDYRMQYVIAQMGSPEKLEELYGKSFADLKSEMRDAIHEQMLVEEMKKKLTNSITVSPREVDAFFTSPSNASQLYYSAEIRLGQIVREITPSKEVEELTELEMLSLRARVLEGEDFERIARQYSDDPSVGRNNGHLGFFRRGELDAEYEKGALQLKVNALSQPIRSSFGFHLIELLEIKGVTYDTRHILLIPEPTVADEARQRELLLSLRDDLIAKKINFEEAVKSSSQDQLTARNGGFFTNAEGNELISVEELDPLLFFALDSMQVGDFSYPIAYKTAENKPALRLLYYKSRIPPHQASLSSDYLKLKAATLQEKRNSILAKWLKSTYKNMFFYIDPEYARCELYNMIKQGKNE